MEYPIIISNSYIDVLRKLLKIISKEQSILFFKKENIYRISIMDRSTLIHVSTSNNNISFDSDELGISNITEFMNYINAINYPANGNINFVQETSLKGRPIDCIVFSDKNSKYRSIVADDTKFNHEYSTKIPMDKSTNPLPLVAKFFLSNNIIERFRSDYLMLPNCKIFSIKIEHDMIKIYMRGSERQQIMHTITIPNIKEINSDVLNDMNNTEFRLFPTSLFSYMYYFGCDFEIELRYYKSGNILALSAFGNIIYLDEKNKNNSNPINIYIGSSEDTSDMMGNNDLIE